MFVDIPLDTMEVAIEWLPSVLAVVSVLVLSVLVMRKAGPKTRENPCSIGTSNGTLVAGDSNVNGGLSQALPHTLSVLQPVVHAVAHSDHVQSDADMRVKLGLKRRTLAVLEDVQQFVQIHGNVHITQPVLDGMVTESGRLTEVLRCARDELAGHPDMSELKDRVQAALLEIGQLLLSARAGISVSASTTGVPRARSRSPGGRRTRSRSFDTLGRLESDIDFQLSRLDDDVLLDVRPGAMVSNDQLRTLHDVVLPQVRDAINACQHALRDYTSCGNYNRDVAAEAQQRCQFATRWMSDLLTRHRTQKLHLDRNVKHKEITFTAFKPGQDASVYEFFSLFENWAEDYLSEEAMADQLYHKYIDASVTESYAEVLPLKGNYRGLKQWLIQKFGSVVPMAHGYIKAINRLPVPKADHLADNIQHLRSIHRLLTSLSGLQISKGVPVPRLQDYLGSNAFLSALFEAIPQTVRREFSKELVREGLEDPYMLEGRHHLDSILGHVKGTYRELEWELAARGGSSIPEPKKVVQQPQSKKTNKGDSSHVSNSPANPPRLTGGNAAPLGQPTQGNRQPQPNQQNGSQGQFNRWLCPLKGHQGHDIPECAEFFSTSPENRREACKYNCCYTCLSKDRRCKGGCCRIEEVPAELICPDCATFLRRGSPPCVLLCGMSQHRKPAPADLVRSLEAWIPRLNLQSLGTTVAVNFMCLGTHSTATPPVTHFGKTSPPTALPSKVVYDTSTGMSRMISNKDTIVKQSQEVAFYTMQTIRIKNKDVLMFFDSGSNGHLIDGELAELLKLDVVTDEMVPIGGVGGKTIWSDYGMYSLTIGPDIYGECHELDVQGLQTITHVMPKVQLEPLWEEANTVLVGKQPMPISIGGSRVNLLVGIKSTKLGPKLLHSLPSGLGIYKSALLDIYESNICFGGPHGVFSKAYREAGRFVNNVEILFTEIASAYMRTPRTFVAASVDDHGPMRSLARELELMDEAYSVFPPSKQGCTDLTVCSAPPSQGGVEQNVLRMCHQGHVSSHIGVATLSCQEETSSQDVSDLIDVGTHSSELDERVGSSVCDADNPEDCDTSKSEGALLRELEAEIVGEVSVLESHKAKVSLQKVKGLQDELDIPEVVEYRCESCSNCPTCKISARAKTKSLQEEFEQDVLKKSVTVDLEASVTRVDLPFIKEPVAFMTKRHGGSDNLYQAKRMYASQCKKRTEVKEQVRKAHQDLVSRGYMVPLNDLPVEVQKEIESAPFRHFYPWKAVYKEESVTTPVRLVVDPSISGLNEILAKGVNMLTKIPELLVHFRCVKLGWSSDITKLYNQLHLNQSALPYSLFLFHESLDPATPPSVWVMTRAWYGVASTGNQAGIALEFLANTLHVEYPAAVGPLTKCRYVDDVISGAHTAKELEEQVRQSQECLARGGFSLKYVVRSGEPPPEKASSDGLTVGCLGMAWNTKDDTIGLAFDSSFFLRCTKGRKPPPKIDLKDSSSLQEVMAGDLMTRAGVLSRVAELYDPCGLFEIVKVQMKLALQGMNGLDWNSPVPKEQQTEWVKLFQIMNELKTVQLPRSVIPGDHAPGALVRLISVADAGLNACGAAVYAGVERLNGEYSCSLILAKSRMVHQTVPRNELEGVVLAAETTLIAQRALGEQHEYTALFTDSRIVLCWVLNKTRKLRMWAFNRVQAVVNMIKWIAHGYEEIPLYHVRGLDNLADVLTKVRPVTSRDLQITSAWFCGVNWMTSCTVELPKEQFTTLPEEDLEPYNKEVFQEVEANHFQESLENRIMLKSLTAVQPDEDTVVSHTLDSYAKSQTRTAESWLFSSLQFLNKGWARAITVLEGVVRVCDTFKHKVHLGRQLQVQECLLCNPDAPSRMQRVNLIIDQAASAQAERSLPRKELTQKFDKVEGVWLSRSRLEKEGMVESRDIDCSPFFDAPTIKRLLPVVLVQSEAFHAYLSHVHLVELPHKGVEVTYRRIRERFHPIGNARQVIAKYKAACSKCRIILRRVVELELADFPSFRTTVTPPFFFVQVDIVTSFRVNEVRVGHRYPTCNALVVVCLLTSATNILAMEGMTTQAVVMALERHAARYGMPSEVYVDSGTQLAKLEDTHFYLRGIAANPLGRTQFKVTVATPKAHHQQGRVEAKVKVLKDMLTAWSKSSEVVNSVLGWETVFARIASAVDDVPIARGSASAATDLGWDIISPNRLKLGRNNYRQLDGPVKIDNCPQSQLQRNQILTARWYELFIERISLLVPPPKEVHERQPEVGDVVLFVHQDPNFKKLWTWRLGLIVDKLSRSTYRIRYSLGNVDDPGVSRFVERSVAQISIILPVDQIHIQDPRFISS